MALNTLVYKVTPSAGRSVQFAIYSIIVTLGAAPFPALGGHMPDWFKAMGYHVDLRVTFFTSILFIAAAALAAFLIREPGARRTRDMVRQLPDHLRKPKTLSGVERDEIAGRTAARVPLFRRLDEPTYAELLAGARTRAYAKGETLFLDGSL